MGDESAQAWRICTLLRVLGGVWDPGVINPVLVLLVEILGLLKRVEELERKLEEVRGDRSGD